MNRQSKRILGLFARYLSLLLIGIGDLYLFYKLLTPITIKTTGTILSFFTEVTIMDNLILSKNVIIEIVPACVAGAAFYLLLFLILSTAEMKPMKRFLALITATAILLILNISRIVFLASITNTPYFQTVHWLFWNFISTIFVVAIWFFIVKICKIKSIPVYSDVIYLQSLINSGKKSKRRKKN